MTQFYLYANEDKASNASYPYFVDVQNPLFDDLNSRLVIPLAPHHMLNKVEAKKLCPLLQVKNEAYVLLTNQMTTVPVSLLKTEIMSVDDFRYEILAAIDMLISGI